MMPEEWILYVALAVEIVNLCLLLGLFHVYWENHKKLKSKFTTGLLLFSSTFLLKSIVFIAGMLIFPFIPHGHPEGGPPITGMFLVNIIECAALSFLFKITWE